MKELRWGLGRLIEMGSMLRRAAVIGILLTTLVIVGGPGTASASPTTSVPVEENGVAWPVPIVGGLIIVAGLVATRGEFRNWRQRRADRN